MIALQPLRDAPFSQTGIMDFPLIARRNTSTNLNSTVTFGKNVYFGTGLITSKSLSEGLPFDFLGMLLTAEWVRQKMNARTIIHEISDAHALANSLHDPNEIARIAREQVAQFTEFAAALDMTDSYRCILASEYRRKTVFRDIQAEIDSLSPCDAPAYLRYQSAGNLYFARHENVGCKIGWLVDDDERLTGLDERSFNYAYAALGVQPLSFIYTWCGWNLDPRRSRVSPYTFVSGEKRIMLKPQKPAFEELKNLMSGCANEKIIRLVILHLARIVAAYGMLFELRQPNFWNDAAADTEPHRFIEVTKPENWTDGKYIDIEKLAAAIDEIRFLQDSAFDSALLSAVREYRAARKAG